MAIGPLRLADKSAWEQARYDSRARDRFHELRQAKQVGHLRGLHIRAALLGS